jgi:hypothetical protein
MSYLRGPLTRSQIKALTASGAAAPPPAAAPAAPAPAPAAAPAGAALPGAGGRTAAPATPPGGAGRSVLPPGVPQHFLPVRGAPPAGAVLVYRPGLLGAGTVRFADSRAGVDEAEDVTVLAPLVEAAVPVDWEAAQVIDVPAADLEAAPVEAAQWAELPAAAARPKSYEAWRRELAGWLYGHRALELRRHPPTGALSRPGESERDFRVRLQESARAERDARVEALRKKYAPRAAALEERERRAAQAEAREREQVTHQGVQAAISVGATILGALLGRKKVSVGDIGRATTAARGAGRVLKERGDVARATDTVEAIRQQRAALEAELQAEVAALDARADPLHDALEPVAIRPRKTHVTVRLCALGWAPHWRDAAGRLTPAWT